LRTRLTNTNIWSFFNFCDGKYCTPLLFIQTPAKVKISLTLPGDTPQVSHHKTCSFKRYRAGFLAARGHTLIGTTYCWQTQRLTYY